MTIGPEEYREALRHFPAGVTIVTLRAGGQVHGLTVSAFASVSPEPPLVAVIIDHKHKASPLLQRPGTSFAVNILGEDQVELSNRFAWMKDEDRFEEGDWGSAATGAPVLEDALVWLDCRIHSSHRAGDHTVFIGEVQASAVPREDEAPLVYWNQGYRRLRVASD